LGKTELGTLRTCARVPRARARAARARKNTPALQRYYWLLPGRGVCVTLGGVPATIFRQYTGDYFRTAVLLSCSTTCITSAPFTRKMPSRSPCPKAAEARGRRPGAGRRRAWGSRGHFGGRCCLTAGATTDHSPDASRLRHPGTSNKVQ